jgi:hypothetical protein
VEAILIVLVGAIVAVLLVGIAVFFYDEGRKQRDLRRRLAFGIGRGHTGARSAPEQELEALAHNPGSFTVKPLPSVQAARFSAEWRRVQQRFTDDPSAAIADAHSLARDVMEARGYLVEGTESKMGVSGPLIIENYRRAHRISRANDRGEARTAELRQALVHYRSLFEELLETEAAVLTRS